MIEEAAQDIRAMAAGLMQGGKAFFPPEDLEAHTAPEFAEIQQKDAYCQHREKNLKTSFEAAHPKQCFHDKNGLLMRKTRLGKGTQILVPVALRAFILRRYHGLPISGHLGRTRVYKQIQKHYWWPGLKADVVRWIRACATCVRRKATRNLHADNPGRTCTATKPWDTIAIDIVSPKEVSAEGYTKILTVLDTFSRWVLAIPLRKANAEEIGQALFRHVFTQFGKPRKVLSDKGTEFVNRALENVIRKWNIENINTGGYQPQANPVERYHRFLNESMTMLCTVHGSNWPEYLPAAVFAYNSSTCESTGFTPFELVFCAKEPTLLHELDLTDLRKELGVENTEEDTAETQAFWQEARNRLHASYIEVRNQQEKMATKNKEALSDRQGSKQSRTMRYEVGDQVMYWEPQQQVAMQTEKQLEIEGEERTTRPSKWTCKWTGPHTIKAKREHTTGYRYTFFTETQEKRWRQGPTSYIHTNHGRMALHRLLGRSIASANIERENG